MSERAAELFGEAYDRRDGERNRELRAVLEALFTESAEQAARIEQLEEAQERAAEFLGRVNLDGIAGVEGWDDDKIDEAKRLIGIARSALRGASLTTAPPSESDTEGMTP